jgi:hypothetical protein
MLRIRNVAVGGGARDAKAACNAFSRDRYSARDERLRDVDERDWNERCEWLHEAARRMAPTQRRAAAAAEAVRVVVDGDRATGYLRYTRRRPSSTPQGSR